MNYNKVISVEEAISKIPNGASIMIGGFMEVGAPHTLLNAISAADLHDLTAVSNGAGKLKDVGICRLIWEKRVKRLITTHIGSNPEAGRQMLSGEMEVELVPQGSMAERIRCGGYGLGGVLTPTGVGTLAAEGKEVISCDGKSYLLEKPLHADVALIRAQKADKFGNLVYHRLARNFNPLMAMAADMVIVEVEEIVEVGELDPDNVSTPGICVDWIVKT